MGFFLEEEFLRLSLHLFLLILAALYDSGPTSEFSNLWLHQTLS